jgi:hypothetical protein
MRLTSALAERSGTERDDGFVLKGVAALTTLVCENQGSNALQYRRADHHQGEVKRALRVEGGGFLPSLLACIGARQLSALEIHINCEITSGT